MITVWVVETFSNVNVGTINGAACRDVCLAHIASSEVEALNFCKKNNDYAEDMPNWHWALTPWTVGCDGDIVQSHHYTRDCKPCNFYGEPDEELVECHCGKKDDPPHEVIKRFAEDLIVIAEELRVHCERTKDK